MKNKPATIRAKVHTIGSLLFQITLASGLCKENLEEFLADLKQDKNDTRIQEVFEALKNIEKITLESDALLCKVKEFVYKNIDPDTPVND